LAGRWWAALEEAELDRKLIARRGATAILKMATLGGVWVLVSIWRGRR